jgi:membrane protease YdiL (CAAX protease family)/RNA polymerase subunit RPABC4/transcription elongation factor Spt4
MTEEKEDKQIVKHCVYCGAKVKKDQAYCPQCGKLVIKIKPNLEKELPKDSTPAIQNKQIQSRTCSNCGSIITSSILEQCPICNAKLEKLPKELISSTTVSTQKRTGFIFSNKKLVPEQKFILKKDVWNFREGIAVFGNSLLAYVTIRFLIILLIAFQFDPLGTGTIDLNITTLILSQIPDIIFGVYPLWYIYSKKHDFKKLSLYLNLKSFLKAFMIALIGSIGLILLDNLSSIIIEFMHNSGMDFFNIFEYLGEEYLVIRNANIFWIILLCVLLSLSVISTELVFRGVLHNSLKAQFENNLIGRISIILIVALIYAGLYLLFSWPVGIYFFVINFFVFIILGILFEINGNLLNTILANIIYNIVLIILIFFF